MIFFRVWTKYGGHIWLPVVPESIKSQCPQFYACFEGLDGKGLQQVAGEYKFWKSTLAFLWCDLEILHYNSFSSSWFDMKILIY